MRIAGLIAIAACRSPADTVESAHHAVEVRSSELWSLIDPDYADPVGDRARLERDVAAIGERHATLAIRLADVTEADAPSELAKDVTAVIDADFVGEVTWKVRGTIRLEVVRRQDGFRIRSGLLTDFRDVDELMARRRAALEANDPEAVRALLHARYRDGDLDAGDAIRRLAENLGGRKVRLEASNYRLELRGEKAHVDEHYVITVDDRRSRPLIGRFTLERSAGRWRIAGGLYPAGAEAR